MKKFSLTDLIIFIVGTELVGALSALISGNMGDFYSTVNSPPLSPPGVVFPVVWTILYALMGASAYIIFRHCESEDSAPALRLYVMQLAVNFSWSIIFFRFRAFGLAAVVAILLAALVGGMIISFYRISKKAGLMNLPYLMWSIFAAYLACGVWILNQK